MTTPCAAAVWIKIDKFKYFKDSSTPMLRVQNLDLDQVLSPERYFRKRNRRSHAATFLVLILCPAC